LFTLLSFLEITEVAQKFGLLSSSVIVMYYVWQKMDRATYWAIFSQTHLVTLNASVVVG
jgi:hypothetical protein